MNNNTIWSQEYSSYVSYAFLPEKERSTESIKLPVKIDITKCIIKVSCFGFYELWLNGVKLRYIGFMDYLKYRKYVKEIIHMEGLT